uniref:Homing endonuclease LAGLIDADG domain-containing protein n=1 Tax=Hypomyces aurantius TaxID=29852 RepID=A0A168RB24_9HYPO|nr:hypothetical protein [Hypomyces aurantius]ANC62719.1 hypothetical protein [Hypomyces aurantius]
MKLRHIKYINKVGSVFNNIPFQNRCFSTSLTFNINNLTNDVNIGQSVYSNTCSSSNNEINNFYAWFSGLADAEGSFRISHRQPFSFVFFFEICLHIDDQDMLYFIQKKLGLGKVNFSGNTVRFAIFKQEEIAQLLDIFTDYPLQSTKYLNYLDLKKAFELYTNRTKTVQSKNSEELLLEMLEIKNGMNTKRSDFSTEALISRKISITPYWLLGFVEGEGSFFISKRDNYRLIFALTQSIKDLALMTEIQNFLYKSFNDNDDKSNYINFVTSKARNNSTGAIQIIISREEIIINKLIPFFNTMTWQSKKYKDYLDWIVILKLKQLGLQYTEKGLEAIHLILNQMNGNRLSSSGSNVDREYLSALLDKLFKGPSNLEKLGDGKIYIKSLNKYFNTEARNKISVEIKDENGLVINTFNSITSCAKFYGLSRSTLHRKLHEKNNMEIIFENKLYYASFRNPDNIAGVESISDSPVTSDLKTEELGRDISNKVLILEKSNKNTKLSTSASAPRPGDASTGPCLRRKNKILVCDVSNLKPSVFIYEKCTTEGFKLIGGFTTPRKVANFMDVPTNTIISYKNSGKIYKSRYKFTSRVI